MNTIRLYHGSLNEITNFEGKIWCSSIFDHANEAILMQDNNESEGSFGHIYFCDVEISLIEETDNFNKFDDSSILNESNSEIIKASEETDQPNWYLIRNAKNFNWIEY
jgi:hypothetical protein